MSSVRVHKQSFAGALPHSFASLSFMVLLGHFDRAEWLPETARPSKVKMFTLWSCMENSC